MQRSAVDVPRLEERLEEFGCVAAAEEAVDLIEAAVDPAHLEALVGRRGTGEPLAWIIGWTDFAGMRVQVNPGVYVPRSQSEVLARLAAVALLSIGPTAQAVDLCTGSGAIAKALKNAVPDAAVFGVDLDPRATSCARRNGIPTVLGDAATALRPRSVDLATAVAPYVPRDQLAFLPRDVQRYEPRLALDGGVEGLEVVRRIIDSTRDALRPGGYLFLELGADQDQRLAPSLSALGFEVVDSWHDEDGDLRGIATRLVRL